MRPTRRHLLKGLALLPAAGLPLAIPLANPASAGQLRFVVDRSLPGGDALAVLAREGGHALAEPRGEIVALFLRERAPWLREPAPIVGLTGWSELVLMRDVARAAGRPLRYAARRGGVEPPLVDRLDGALAALVPVLRAEPPRRGPGRGGSFLWVV